MLCVCVWCGVCVCGMVCVVSCVCVCMVWCVYVVCALQRECLCGLVLCVAVRTGTVTVNCEMNTDIQI